MSVAECSPGAQGASANTACPQGCGSKALGQGAPHRFTGCEAPPRGKNMGSGSAASGMR